MNSYHVLVDAKNEYTKQLIMMLVEPIFEGIQSIYNYTKNLAYSSNPQFLKHFQHLLSDIPKWTTEMLETECRRIILKSKCNWISELITAVFVSHTKVLTIIKVNKNNDKTIDLKVPNEYYFIHKCYIEVARQFWKRPYLFDHRVSNIELQINHNESEKIIGECIEETVRRLLPVKNILKEYLGNDYTDDLEDDISECMPRTHTFNVHKMIQKDLELSLQNKNKSDIDDNYSNYTMDIITNELTKTNETVSNKIDSLSHKEELTKTNETVSNKIDSLSPKEDIIILSNDYIENESIESEFSFFNDAPIYN